MQYTREDVVIGGLWFLGFIMLAVLASLRFIS